MDFQYAVDLRVTAQPARDEEEGAGTGVSADEAGQEGRRTVHRALLDHVLRWLTATHQDALSAENLDRNGDLTLTPSSMVTRAGSTTASRRLTVRVAGDDQTRAHRIDLRTPLHGQDADLLTRITIASGPALGPGASLRLVMGPTLADGHLAPIRLAALRRPGLLRQVAADPVLRSVSAEQVVDGRLINVRAPEEIGVVAEALRDTERLPVLLLSPVRQGAWSTAHECAKELSGLATVVTLGSLAARQGLAGAVAALSPADEGTSPQGSTPVVDPSLVLPPRGGARLVWPGARADADHPAYTQAEVEGAAAIDGYALAEHLLRTLGALAVAARGFDQAWALAERAERAAEAKALRERTDAALAAATAAGDSAGQVQALREQVAAARGEAALAQQMAEQEEALRVAAERTVRDLTAKVEGLQARLAGRAAATVPDPVETVDWSGPPAMVKKQEPVDLFAWLSERSGGALAFHPNAARAWRKSNYAEPERMRAVLVTLAQAAQEWAMGEEVVDTGRRVDWFRERGLNLAPHDTNVRRSRKALFEHEGEELDAEPHIKVGDNTNPSLCGRIYFAFSDSRLVAYHVGSHDLAPYRG